MVSSNRIAFNSTLLSPPFYSPPLPISCRSSGIDESNPRNKGLQSSSMTSSRFRRSPASLFFQPPGKLQQKKAGEASVCSLANVPWNSLQPSCWLTPWKQKSWMGFMLGPRKSKTLFLPQHLELKALATRAQKSVIVPPYRSWRGIPHHHSRVDGGVGGCFFCVLTVLFRDELSIMLNLTVRQVFWPKVESVPLRVNHSRRSIPNRRTNSRFTIEWPAMYSKSCGEHEITPHPPNNLNPSSLISEELHWEIANSDGSWGPAILFLFLFFSPGGIYELLHIKCLYNAGIVA